MTPKRSGGKIEHEGQIPDGTIKEFYQSGKIRSERNFKDGREAGVMKEFYEEGYLKSEVTFIKGNREGDYREYYPEGKVSKIIPYTNGCVNGIYKAYNKDGTLEHENVYENSQLKDNLHTYQYYENGVLKHEYYRHGDAKSATSKDYFENGKLWKEAIIEGGKISTYKEYDEKGNLISD